MADSWNIERVEPYDWDEPASARQLAEAIAAGSVEFDPDVSTAVSSAIDEAAQEILHPTEVDSFIDYDAEDERNFVDFGNGSIGVHWIAAQLVQGGTAEEIAKSLVSEFREWRETELQDRFPDIDVDPPEEEYPEGLADILNEAKSKISKGFETLYSNYFVVGTPEYKHRLETKVTLYQGGEKIEAGLISKEIVSNAVEQRHGEVAEYFGKIAPSVYREDDGILTTFMDDHWIDAGTASEIAEKWLVGFVPGTRLVVDESWKDRLTLEAAVAT
ncbi:hypothetical protein ACS3QZ_19615 (plasmid) [Shimia sp. W99]